MHVFAFLSCLGTVLALMGPVASAHAQDAHPVLPPGAAVQVNLSPPVGLSFYGRREARGRGRRRHWIKLCDAECTVALRPGTYYLGAGRSADSVIAHPQPVAVDRDMRLEATVETHLARRLYGGFMLGTGGTVGLAMLSLGLASTFSNSDCEEDCDLQGLFDGLTIGAGVILLAGVALPGLLILQRDEILLQRLMPRQVSRTSRVQIASSGLGVRTRW